MSFSKGVTAVIGAMLLLGSPAAAAINRVTVSGEIQSIILIAEFGSLSAFNADQQALISNLGIGSAYSFVFEYDSAQPNVRFDGKSTLVSGSIGSLTDFSHYLGGVYLSQYGIRDELNLGASRFDYEDRAQYQFVNLRLEDNEGGLFPSISELPATIDVSTIDRMVVSFEVRGPGAGRYRLSTPSVVTSQAVLPPPPPVVAVPEPATWAMMIGGFGLAGAMLRRRRGAVI